MSRGKISPEKVNIDIGKLSDISKVPADITPESLEFLKGLIDSFNQSAAGLKEAYLALQNKFDKLNLKLEEANRDLKNSLEEQGRLSNYLTNILESLSSGVLVVDNEGVITLFNRGAEIITGINVEKAIGKKYRDVMGEDVPDELTPLHVLTAGAGQSQLEKTILSKDGENIPVGFSISPLLNSDGELLGAVEIFMDMSRIKALEDEISRMDKLAALGQMSATMAHKIRNPLGGIVGYAGIIGKNSEENNKVKTHVQRIVEGVEKINHIIESVLSYNAQLKLSPREIDLNTRIDEIINIVKQDMEDNGNSLIGFTVSQPTEAVIVEADPEYLTKALLDILHNAVESIEGEGNIDVKIIQGSSKVDPSCILTSGLLKKMRSSSRLLKSQRPCSIISITDSGCGMDDKTFKNLFIPFFTTKENGIGLGLASAQKIVEEHHGEIWMNVL